MKDYIYWNEYDDAKTGTRITIELYKSTNNNGVNPIDTSETNRVELPYNTLSVKNIDVVLNDTRIGLSAPCYASIDVDFSTLENTEHLEDLQEAILFPQKKMSFGAAFLNETVGTTWKIYEQHKLIGKNEFEEKKLIFVGQHTVGLQGEFNFSKNNVTVAVENIVSFVLKRLNTRLLFDAYSYMQTAGTFGLNEIRNYMTTQVFYNHIEYFNMITGAETRQSLMFSPLNMIGDTSPGNTQPRSYNLRDGLIVLWRLDDLLKYIDLIILFTIARATRNYTDDASIDLTQIGQLNQIFSNSFPLYKQKYDNSGEFGIRMTNLFVIAQIKIQKTEDKPRPSAANALDVAGYYNIWDADNILFQDGRYKYLLDFVNDLCANFCVFANYTNTGISLSDMSQSSSVTHDIIINLDTDGIEYTLDFGISYYSKLNISNLEFYDADVRDKTHENNYAEIADGLNIVTIFHNQPPNNSAGWKPLLQKNSNGALGGTAVASSGGTPENHKSGKFYDWGYWGSKSRSDLDMFFDILKIGNRLGEKFALNLFYREKDPTTTERSIADKFISVHNGIEKDEEGKALNIEYPSVSNIGAVRYSKEMIGSVTKLQDHGCMHNSIAKYIQDSFNDDDYPFCVLTLKIPVQELSKILYANCLKVVDGLEDYPKFLTNFLNNVRNDKVVFRMKTNNTIAGKAIIKEFWLLYAFKYNIADGYLEMELH